MAMTICYTNTMKHNTVENAKKEIGKIKEFTFNHLTFLMKVKDVRMRIGKLQYLMTPVKGSGEDWIQSFVKKNKILKK